MPQILSRNQFNATLNRKIKQNLQSLTKDMRAISAEAGELAKYMQETIVRGGKRSRPYLLYTLYVGYGGGEKHYPWNVAISFELLHQFLQIHDDIIDHDYNRYDEPNIAGKYIKKLFDSSLTQAKKEEISNAMALLAGDLCYSHLIKQITSEKTLSSDVKIKLLNELARTMQLETDGQQRDILFTLGSIENYSIDNIKHMYVTKTGAYTFMLPFRWAQILNNKLADESATNFSKFISIALQTDNDLKDIVMGSAIGKPLGSDLREGKKTLPIKIAHKTLSAKDWNKLQKLARNTGAPGQMNQIQDLLAKNGVIRKAQAEIKRYLQKSFEHLDKTKLNQPAKTEIKKIARSYVKWF